MIYKFAVAIIGGLILGGVLWLAQTLYPPSLPWLVGYMLASLAVNVPDLEGK